MPDETRPRRDAQRNRDRLVEVAREALLREPGLLPLETIATRAGVGIGTLYRHFPSREALTQAVYRAELDALCAQAPGLLSGRSPAEALRAWMSRYANFVVTKRGMMHALREAIGAGAITSTDTRRVLAGAVEELLAAGRRTGQLRDVAAADVVAALAGALMAATSPEQVERLLDLLVDGLRGNAGPDTAGPR